MAVAPWFKLRRWVAGTRVAPCSHRPFGRADRHPRLKGLELEWLEARCLPAVPAELTPVAFSVAEDRATWGQTVHVRFGLNSSAVPLVGPFLSGDSLTTGPFTAQVVLSRDQVIDDTDPVLRELSFDDLAPGPTLY